MTMKYTWKKLIPKPDPTKGAPCERSSHGLSLVNKRLILYGGEQVARTPISSEQALWSAHQDDNGVWSWLNIQTEVHPPPRVAHAQAVYKDSVYIFGGRAGIQMEEAAMNDLWKLDCSGGQGAESWSRITPSQDGDTPPEPRSFHKMLCIGSSLYVFGGCGASGRLADLSRYDILTNTWKTLPTSALRGRGGANFIPLQSSSMLGVIAGFCGEESKDGHLFEIAEEKWQADVMADELEGLRPRSVCISSSFPSVGVSLLFGGEVDPSDRGHEGAGGFESDIVLLDEKTARYSETLKSNNDENWPEPRGWSDGDYYDTGEGSGELFFFGGLTGDDVQPKRLDDLWQLHVQKV